MCVCIILFTHYSTYKGKPVKGKDYVTLLNELVNICALCNDSTLGYSEVS